MLFSHRVESYNETAVLTEIKETKERNGLLLLTQLQKSYHETASKDATKKYRKAA
jgi:hypothetical protein